MSTTIRISEMMNQIESLDGYKIIQFLSLFVVSV
jgi:hypothetical protein